MSYAASTYQKLKNTGKILFEFSQKHCFISNLILAFITVFITEIFSRGSIIDAIGYMILYFPSAAMSMMIVQTMLMIPLAFKKSLYWKYFISAFWITLSIVDFIMFSMRMMPFNFTDIMLIPSTFTVLPVYLSIWQMILIGAVVVALIFALVYIYRKTPVLQAKPKISIIFFTVMLCVSFSYYFFASSVGIINNRVSGLINKYKHNGFVYCFTSSTVDTGMREPADYSASQLADIMRDINNPHIDKPIKANIIFLQLESFFDVNTVQGISYSQNPMPVFSELLDKNSHGFLNVPTFSAGTANTEFEVLTAMNIDFFGIGEFPYQSVVEDTVTESAPFALKEQGYTSHAIHNNSATFYNRNVIYSNLGFDTFTSLEYMYNTEYNELGWAKDMSLLPSIEDCLDSTKGPDFIYAVGVQTHGAYTIDEGAYTSKITVVGIDNPNEKNSYQYYINQLREVDSFLGALISELELRAEPTALVIFGDHKPGFNFEKWNTAGQNMYQTEYVLWSNFKMDQTIKDVESYQLYPYVLDRLNITGGTMSKFHQKYDFASDDKYLSDFELIQYDMIYGDGIGYEQKNYSPSALKLGIKNISIDEVNDVADSVYIHGNNFNEFSSVYVNSKRALTRFINKENLVVSSNDVKKGDKITVCQIDKNGTLLSETKEIVY